MYLKSLELLGFKSFGKKAKLNFTTPITSIVGPNGSGKSNVAEGFRFALGEQRMTQLRGKKTSDLIWNGSSKVPKSQRATVKLTFDNSQVRKSGRNERLLDVDFDDVIIERVIHRDASTDYKVNGSPARLKDIVELLAGAHIGASGHHIISQGETDLILNVNLRERRSMIEDALGLKVYQYKKDEGIQKLEKVEINKKEVESLRREIKPHMKFLKKQMEKVEKAREQRSELKSLYEEYLSREKDYITKTEKLLEEDIKPIETELKSIRDELSDAEEALSTLAHKEEASQESRELEETLEKLQQEKETLTRESGRIEGALEAEERRQRMVIERALEEAHIQIARKDFDELKKHLDDVSDAPDDGTLRELLEKLREGVSSFISKYKSSRIVEGQPPNDVVEIKKKYESVQKNLEELDVKIKKTQKDIKSLQDKVSKERESLRGAERATYELKTQESELKVRLSALEGKKNQLSLEKEDFNSEEKEARVIVGTLSGITISKDESRGKPLEESRDRSLDEARDKQMDRKKRIERLKIRLEDSGGGSSEDISHEYNEVTERDSFLERELSDLEKSAGSLKELIGDLDEKIVSEFKEGVTKINTEFQKFFGLMFGGGNASLSVVRETKKRKSDFDIALSDEIPEENGMEEGEEGVEIQVSLPRKKIQGLQMLSGGERALTSIALLFAMSQVNPPPFLVLDETDAALDEANSKRYGDMIEELAKKSQLILISHNRETMSRAGVLYGVTMGADGVSQLLSVGFEEAIKVAK